MQPLLRYCWLKLACLKYCNNQSIHVCKFSWWEHVSFSDRVGIGLPKLTGNAGPQKSPKIRHLGTIAQLCRAISLQLRHVSINGKKRLKQQYLHHMSLQYGEHRPTRDADRFISLLTPAKLTSMAFASWQRYCTAV